jgi:3-hydroxyacyl-CoA dehydrogenase
MTATVGVLGAGVMGSGIAQVMSIAGYSTRCFDTDAEALDRARDLVTDGRFGLNSAVERGKLSRTDADAALSRLTFTNAFETAANVDVVIEAIPELIELKVRAFRDLDSIAPPATIFASNTSGFPIAALAAATDRPDRVVGWHWASPAPVMRLAEIVRTPETSAETIAVVEGMAQQCAKNPIVVNDAPTNWGFVANRVYFAMVREANCVVGEGIATHEQVDAIMTDCFRWPAGPFGMVQGATGGWK